MTVATAVLTTGASAVPLCPLTNNHYDGIANFHNYAHWGVEGLIAPAFGSEVFNAYRSQILVWVGILDARRNLGGGFGGCYGSDCQNNVYDTGIVDSAGFHMLEGHFNSGSGDRRLGAGWYNQGQDFQITAVAEMQNFDPNQSCPNVFHQEVGTFGYRTYQSYYSNVNLYERNSRNWVSWDFIGSHFMDAPYFDGFFRQYGAWNVETRP